MQPIHDPLLGGAGGGGSEVLREGGQLYQRGLSCAALLCLESLLLILRHIPCMPLFQGLHVI